MHLVLRRLEKGGKNGRIALQSEKGSVTVSHILRQLLIFGTRPAGRYDPTGCVFVCRIIQNSSEDNRKGFCYTYGEMKEVFRDDATKSEKRLFL